jgi:hypothetical protein
MKKLILLLLIANIFPLGIFAQVTGGNSGDGGTKPIVKNQEKGVFSNTFFIAFGMTSSMGKFNENVLVLHDIVGNSKGGMSKGYTFTMGSNFYLKNIDLTKIGMPDNLRLGIDVTYLNLNFTVDQNSSMQYSGFYHNSTTFLGAKVGPFLSYNPIGNLIIDAKFTLQPTVVFYHNYIENSAVLYNTEDYVDGIAVKLRKGLGIYTIYKPFMLGIELSWGKANFKQMYVYDNTGDYTYNDDYIEKKLGTTRFDFVLGFAF